MSDLPARPGRASRPWQRKARWLTGAAMAGALVVPLAAALPAQGAPAAEQFGPPTRTVKCWFPMPGTLVEGRDVVCRETKVPLRHDRPKAGQITLATATLKATSTRKRGDAILFLTGGPGQSGVSNLTEFVTFIPDGLLKTRAERDIVFVDQRGTGYSEPQLSCPELLQPGDPDAQVKQCHARLSGLTDLSAYTTENNAKDMDVLRRALGYRQWNLYGVSYGSKLGYNVLRYAPKGTVRSAILGSPIAHRPNWITAIPQSMQSGLNGLYSGCRKDPACRARYGDLRALTEQTFKNLNADPFTFATDEGPATYDGVALADLFFDWLYTPPLIRVLPELVDAFHDRDAARVKAALSTQPFALAATRLRADEPRNPDQNDGMYFSIICSEEVAYGSPADVDRSAARVSDVAASRAPSVKGLMSTCKDWPVNKASDDYRQPVSSTVPTMVVAGSYDPVTPPSNGAIMKAALTNSQLVVVRSAGHSQFEWIEACATQLMTGFYRTPGPIDATCAKEPLTFAIPGTPAAAAAKRELQRQFDLVRMTRDLTPFAR